MSTAVSSTSHQAIGLEQFKKFYQKVKEEFQAGKKTDIPPYIVPLFEKGPGYFLTSNLNVSRESLYDQQKELPEEEKALLVFQKLSWLMTWVSKEMKQKSCCAFTIIPNISDQKVYLINYRRIVKYLLRPWLKNQNLKMKYSEESGLGAKKATIRVVPSNQSSERLDMRSLV